ncbi:ATP-binding protein [Tenacibaculum sp. 190130A14a]
MASNNANTVALNRGKTATAQKDKTNDSIYKVLKKLYKIKKYPEVLKEALIVFNNAKNDKDFFLMYQTAEIIADVYKKSFNYKLSIKYYKLSIESLNNYKNLNNEKLLQNDNLDLLSKSYLKIGATYLSIYRNLKHKYTDSNYQKLLDVGVSKSYDTEFSSVEDITKFKDSAYYYFSKLEELPSLNDEILKSKAISHINMSAMYQLDSMYVEAKESVLKAIEIHKKRNDKIRLAQSLTNLGGVYSSTGEYNKAKETYYKGIETIKKNESEEAIKLKADLYFNLAWAMRNLKDYKAYDYQELSYEIEDVLKEKDIRDIIKKIEANHKENLEAQKIDYIKEQRKLKEAEDSRAKWLFSLLSVLVLLISGVVIYNYKLRQKNLSLKLSESNLLQQQSIEKLKSEAQIKILNATIDGKESERKLIAETLHDNVSALLSSANMHLSATKKQYNGDTPLEVEKTRAIILEASQKVRDLSHNLVSSILLKFGLEYAVKDVAKKYSNSQLAFEVSAQNINRYNQEFEIKIFNIIQELINNIIKHSKANHAKIALKEEKDQLTILIRDDGVGFAPSSSSIKDGIGLNQIDARVHVMNGKFIMSSEINKGTEAIITVPIQQQKKEFKLTSVS